jgi:hypothetical protein
MGGTPKPSVFIAFSIINHPAIGVAPFMDPPIKLIAHEMKSDPQLERLLHFMQDNHPFIELIRPKQAPLIGDFPAMFDDRQYFAGHHILILNKKCS